MNKQALSDIARKKPIGKPMPPYISRSNASRSRVRAHAMFLENGNIG